MSSTTTSPPPMVTSTVTTTTAPAPPPPSPPPSAIIKLTDLSFNTSGSSPNPDISLNYDNTYVYFNKFRPDRTGMVYSYVSTAPTVYLKPNSKSKDIELYYSKSITVSRKIHDITNTSSNDLELFIEHTPSPSNFNKKILYVCICLTYDLSSNSANGFNTFFDNIEAKNMQLDTQSQNATLDNLKMNQKMISFTGGILNYIDPQQSMFPAGAFYTDVSGNSVMVLNKPVKVSSSNYTKIQLHLNSAKQITDILDTNISPKDLNSIYPITCGIKVNESFTSLREGFANLKEGLETKYQYCRPSDSSNGNLVTTVAINSLTQNEQDSQIIDWIIVSVVMLILIIFLYFTVPDGYIFINEKLGYNIGMKYILQIVTGLIFVGGGIAAIICSRLIDECPKWITQLGIFVVIAYTLFQLMIFAQKDTIRNMLKKKLDGQNSMASQINEFIHTFLLTPSAVTNPP